MNKARFFGFFLVTILLASVTVLSSSGIAVGAEAERSISLSTTYTGITIAKNQSVTLPIKVTNLGDVDEQVDIGITTFPEEWVVDLVNEESGAPYRVCSLYLATGGEELVYFRARPPAGVEPGDYVFLIEAVSQDELVKSSLEITIGIEEKAAALGRVKLTCTYPDLQGKGSTSFEYKVDVTNEGSEDRTFSFSAEAPPEWEVSFRPGYEAKQIATMGIKAGETSEIKVELTPPKYVRPSEYSVTVRATSGNIQGTINLTATVLEEEKELTYELEMLTPTGLLSTEAYAGHESHLSVLVTNRGSAVQEDVNLYSSKPDGWDVTFTPDTIESLLPGATREVRVAITPTSKTIAGDYSVGLRVGGYKASDRIEMRVTVGASTIWGWVGLAIVLAVIAGMATLFWRLGRR